MSYPARGKAVPSSSSMGYRHDSMQRATDESGTASSSMQPQIIFFGKGGIEINFGNNNNNNNNNKNNQHPDEALLEQMSQLNQLHFYPPDGSPVVQSLPRSSPIAIRRASVDGKKEIDESDTDDDDDSEIDVQGDAIKLQIKYGNKVTQTYAPDSTMLHSHSHSQLHPSNTTNRAVRDDKTSSSVLNAPYLGSMSGSSNQVSSLPPMSLAGNGIYLQEPPDTVVSYGSLRDSHQRGRFMDGPSSYREPSSGKIRHLDHRLRYHGKQAKELNIGERLQQSRKLKELRQMEESKKLREGSRKNNDGSDSNDATDGGEEQERKPSSLSAMMEDASKTKGVNASGLRAVENARREGYSPSSVGPERLAPIQKDNCDTAWTTTQSTHEHVTSMDLMDPSSRNMLSASLTAFELLKTTNTETFSHSSNDTIAGQQSFPTQRNRTTDSSTNCQQQATDDSRYHARGFQPLARSMSDPSPRFQSVSHSDTAPPTSRVLSVVQAEGLAAQMEQRAMHQPSGTVAAQLGAANYGTTGNINNYRVVCDDRDGTAPRSSTIVGSSSTTSLLTSQQRVNFFHSGSGHRSPHLDHDPNTDGAFGDMDL